MAKFKKIDASKLKMIIIGLVIALAVGYNQWDKMSPSAKRKITKTFNFNKQTSKPKVAKASPKSRYSKKSSKKSRYSKGPRKKSKQNASRKNKRHSNSIQRASDR